MRTKFNGILTLLLAFVVQISFAQEKTITGTVTDQDGLPLPGVNIVVEGTTNGTQTDFDGNYSISSSEGQTLLYSYIGQKDVRQTVGATSTINVQMEENAQALEEVVVTALGIKREQKSLGYAVSKVASEELEQKSEGDIGRLLQGKAAGVNITASNGLTGSSSNVVIRGNTSITGNNQALFVVDGIPFNSGSNQQSDFRDGRTESNRFLDIDPNNIEDISILKGLSATALYGNRGRNGVILITTKSGAGNNKGASKLSITTSVFASNPHLPTYQDEFAGGFNNTFGWFFSNWGPRFKDPTANYQAYQTSTGADGTVFVTHPFATNVNQAFIEGYEDLAASEYELKPYNSVENFFRQGLNTTTSINLTGGNSDFGYTVGYTKLDDEGFTPGNELSRNNFTVGANGTLGKLKINASINVARTDYKSPPIASSRGSGVIGGGGSIFSDIFYTPRNVDLVNIPFQRADGGSLYYRETNGIQHPLWTVENVKTGQKTTNIFSSFSTVYSVNDNLSLAYRFGFNTYTENGFYAQNRGGIDGNPLGLLRTTNIVNTSLDHNFSINYDKDLSDKFNLKGILGFNSNRIEFDQDGVESTNQVVFGILRHFNFTQQSTTNSFSDDPLQEQTRENTYGVFGDLTLSYDNYLYLNVQGRNDWTSTLESDNNSIFYPSASLSFIPTSAIDGLQSKAVNYLKLRLGYGSSAGFPPTYSTRTTLSLNGNLFVDRDGNNLSGNDTSFQLGNADLVPELVTEFEAGIDAKLWDNRIGLNTSVFKRKTTDLITRRLLPPSEGFTQSFINGGTLENEGIELGLTYDMFRNPDGFNLDFGLTLYADEPVITELPEGINNITIGGPTTVADARNAAVPGEPYGVFLGSTVDTDDDGNLLVDDNGTYVATASIDNIIGDPNADYTANFRTNIGYKNLRLSVDLAYRHGGDVYSRTVSTLQNRGVIEFPFSREGTYILPGVSQSTGQPNNVQINATDIAFDNWLFGPANFKIYDGSMLRLNEVSLAYDFSDKILDKTPFSNINITLLGSNLWYRAFNTPKDANFDPNVNSAGVSNAQGLDFFSGPSAARYGFSMKFEF
ncbi:SusC/RagA family TonB-linked outer membrane protein [uncultured Maribacter sp.]|uniref:SusC/RagA family TonB-linked outer membrane protein n=1 Tax=uncultured Maribacter sp. TaxID=431308 RepID=UPI00261E2C41|nr:SusC/RagA family TonB-linked outer membrane protein [uncultured Maribacter sp.]